MPSIAKRAIAPRACLLVLSIFGLCFWVAAGCGDSSGDDQPPCDPATDVSCERTTDSGDSDIGDACPRDDGECTCTVGDSDSCPSGTVCHEGLCRFDDEAVCTEGTRWESGTPAFREASDDWGLPELGVEGTRISVVDFDGDGWPDLIVRRAGAGLDTVAPDDDRARRVWLLRNTGEGRFEDVTEESGLLAMRIPSLGEATDRRPAEVFAFGDVTNNGALDVFTGVQTGDGVDTLSEGSELLLGTPGGGWMLTESPNDFTGGDAVGAPGGASFVDVDRDGRLDLFVANNTATQDGSAVFLQDRLFRGRGDGRFTDVTPDAGLVTNDWGDFEELNEARAHTRAWGALACDLSGNGTPDLLVPSYGRSPNHLWRGERDENGHVSFENRSVDSGYAFDDNMEWHDNQFARCFCQQNPDAEDCDGVPAPQIQCTQMNWNHGQDREPFRMGGNSGTTVCADLNNSGHMDLLTTEIRHWWAGDGSDVSEILVNSGDSEIRFDRPGREATGIDVPRIGSSWDEGHITAAVFDFDNDGWPDIWIGATDYPGNRGLLFHQDSPLSFRAVPEDVGVDHHRAHGVAVADFNRNGALDMVVGHSRGRCANDNVTPCYERPAPRLYENVIGADGNFIQLRLEGAEGTNRSAIGARVRVSAGGVTQTQEVGGGHGHYGMQNDLVLHFGLGEACEAEIEIRWPNEALSTERYIIPSGARVHVLEGGALRPLLLSE